MIHSSLPVCSPAHLSARFPAACGKKTVCVPDNDKHNQCAHCHIAPAGATGGPTAFSQDSSHEDSPSGNLGDWLYSLLQQDAPISLIPGGPTKEDALFCHFQPIVDAWTGNLFGYEALLRARNDKENQIVSAGSLIDACQRQGLQHVLDQRARRTAIRYAAALGLPENVRVFINFLPNTIYNPEICLRTTMEAAQTFGVPLEKLVFEVVETEKIPDMARLRRILAYYQGRGAATAIDDMGAGYAAVEYIQALHPQFVKIDGDVLHRAENGPRDLLYAIIAAAKDVGATVVAEQIETESHLELAREAGADLLQGFLIAPPALPPLPIASGLFPDLCDN